MPILFPTRPGRGSISADGLTVTGLPASGSATDAQPAIQAALNLANSLGVRTVILPLGVYQVNSAITVPENVTLVGSGVLGSELKANAATLGNWLLFSSNSGAENLRVNGSYVSGGPKTITDALVRLRSTTATAIENVTLKRVYFYNAREVALKVFGNVKRVLVDSCEFVNCYLASHVCTDDTPTYEPTDVTYQFCKVRSGWGAVTDAQSGAFKFSGAIAGGLNGRTAKGPRRINVFKCFIESPGQMGTEYWHYAGGLYQGNTVVDAGFGISAAQACFLTIKGNNFRRCSSYCIEHNAPSGPVMSRGNVCDNLLADGVTRGTGAGISFNADFGVGEKSISDGDILINCATAASFYTSKGTILRNVTIEDCDLALDINSCSDVDVCGRSYVRGTVTNCVWLKTSVAGSSNVRINGVVFECSSVWGFRVSATGGRQYTGLEITDCDTTRLTASSGGTLFENFADSDLPDCVIDRNVPIYNGTVLGVALPRINKKTEVEPLIPFTSLFGAHANYSNAAQTQTSQAAVPIMFDVTGAQFQVSNMARIAGTVAPNGNALTCKAALLVNGTRYPLNINGQRTFVLAPGAVAWTDPFFITLRTTDTVFFLLYTDAGSGGYTPQNRQLRGSSAGYTESWITSADYTDAGSFPAISQQWAFTFQACRGLPIGGAGRGVVILGDSIANGVGDTQTNTGRGSTYASAVGFFGRACQTAGVGIANVAVGGDRLSTFLTTRHLRGDALSRATNVLCNYGTNDIYNGASFAAMRTNFLEFCSWLRRIAPGVPLFWATCVYQTSSTDYWLTPANQTVNGTYKAVVDAWNAYLLDTSAAGARAESGGVLSGVYDVANVMQTPADGKWRAGVLAHTSTLSAGAVGSVTLATPTAASRLYDQSAVIVITAGTGAGQVRPVNAHSSTTVLSVSVNFTTAPDATSTVQIWETFTQDGVHPTWRGHNDSAAIINPRKFNV